MADVKVDQSAVEWVVVKAVPWVDVWVDEWVDWWVVYLVDPSAAP